MYQITHTISSAPGKKKKGISINQVKTAADMKVETENRQCKVNFTFRQTAHTAALGPLTGFSGALLFDLKD